MPRARLGPWGRWYASTIDDTAHYTDRQFRAWANVFGRAVAGRGELPKLRPLRALIGADEVDFLVSEGRLAVGPDDAVSIVHWDAYQAPVDRTNAERQARHRQRMSSGGQGGDNGSNTVTNTVDKPFSATSTTTNVDSDRTETVGAGARGPDPEGDHDALDRYYELTRNYPWGRRAGEWLVDLQSTHGDVHLTAALEVEWAADKSLKTLLGRVAARLERQAHRVEQAKAKERKTAGPFEPGSVLAEIRAAMGSDEPEPEPEMTPESIAAGKAAFEALRGQLASGNGSLLGSKSGDRVGSQGSARRNGGTAGSQRPPRSAPSGLRGDVERSVPPRDGRHEAPTDGAS